MALIARARPQRFDHGMDEPGSGGKSTAEGSPPSGEWHTRIDGVGHWGLATVTVAAAGCAWLVGGMPGGLLYALIFAASAVPGLPLGFALFGARHPGGWIARRTPGLPCHGSRPVAPDRGRRPLTVHVAGVVECGHDGGVARDWAPSRAVCQSPGVAPGRLRRSRGDSRPDARPCDATPGKSWRARGERGSRLPGVLHRGLRLAHGGDRRTREVHDAAAESLPGIRADSLLLDLLSDTGCRLPARPRPAQRRATVSEDQRARDRTAVHVGRLPGRVDGDRTANAGDDSRRACPRRGERRGQL